ncbi:pentapeptide repeat-containing protein [Herpetosiphon llansteffanensis]|uniref:pentapeptide repeat-containing protein n=1 Tax=Herpetosiphon llansteffanensis TaxID=2094568 RepID=UPI000D7B99B8|nr:pentapeptide repeat-containing protein [Herpetosiphon llansteffanensis]
MRYFSQQKLDQLLDAHAEWLQEQLGEAMTLRNCDLRGMDLRGRSLMRMQFENVILAGCDLRGCNFFGARLQQVDLQAANLAKACFESSFCKQIDARQSNWQQANLISAIIKMSDFSQANLAYADLNKTDVETSVFDQAIFRYINGIRLNIGRSSLRHVQFDHAILDFATFYNSDLRGANLNAARLRKLKSFENLAVAGLQAKDVVVEAGRFAGWFDASPEADGSQRHDADWLLEFLANSGEVYAQ